MHHTRMADGDHAGLGTRVAVLRVWLLGSKALGTNEEGKADALPCEEEQRSSMVDPRRWLLSHEQGLMHA